MKKKILFVLVAILLIGTGCSGAEGPIGGPAGLTPETEEPESPGGSNPFFVSGGETDGDEAPAAPAKPTAPPPKAQGTEKTPSITCFEKVLAEGGVGAPYNQKLEAAGGSGGFTYELSSGELPAGLALAGDGAISGTPEEVGNFKPKVIVTDGAEKKKECKVEITVKGDLSIAAALISAPETEGRWDAVYEVTVPDDVADIAWSWTGDTTNVCASGTKPDVADDGFRQNCSLSSLSGNVAYVWLKADQPEAASLTLTLTATSPYAPNPASQELTFAYTACGNGVVEEGEECDGGAGAGFTCNDQCVKEKIPAQAQSVAVTTWTGDAGNDSDTGCDVHIQFCTDASLENCTDEQELKDEDDNDDRENGDENVSDAADGLSPDGITEAHKYFQLRMGNDCGKDTNSWLLQGIRVEIAYQGTPTYTYFNPCAEKWMDDGDRLPFGPNDTAVCAIITTGGRDKAGTDDSVYLVLKNFNGDQVQQGLVRTQLTSWSSHFTTVDEHPAIEMHWGGCDDGNDFENGDDASYGDYLFDVAPFGGAPTIFIQKSPDGDDGGWDLHSAEVFIFRPGKFLNAPPPADGKTVYHGSFIYDVWLEDEGKLTTETNVLKEASPNIIGIGIGQVWEDG